MQRRCFPSNLQTLPNFPPTQILSHKTFPYAKSQPHRCERNFGSFLLFGTTRSALIRIMEIYRWNLTQLICRSHPLCNLNTHDSDKSGEANIVRWKLIFHATSLCFNLSINENSHKIVKLKRFIYEGIVYYARLKSSTIKDIWVVSVVTSSSLVMFHNLPRFDYIWTL